MEVSTVFNAVLTAYAIHYDVTVMLGDNSITNYIGEPTMNNRLFSNTATNSNPSLSEQLSRAIKNNDSATIDQLLLESK